MYEFRDTTASEFSAGNSLPAEAMSFNGKYFENEITGYRTLHVSGREILSSEVQTEDINLIDGSKYYGKRYPARTVTVTYQLIAENDTVFRQAYNKLNLLLRGEQVQIIFNDEPDKYFIGTAVGNTDPEPGTNAVTGEIEIYCSDPVKYSTTLKEVTASANDDGVLEAVIENNGSVPVSIDYEITHNAETGYIGIVSENGGTMQYGKIDEADKEPYKRNETLLNLDDFIDAPDDITSTDAMHPHYGTKGTLTTKTWFGKTFLTFGSKGTTVGDANGGMRTVVIPQDSEGELGAKTFYAYFHLIFYAGLMGQTGEMSISFLTADDKLIAGLNWFKTDTVGNTGYYEFITYNPNSKSSDLMAGKVLKQFYYTTNHLQTQNPWYWDWGHCDLFKEGSNLRYFYYGSYYNFVVPEIENFECAKIQISCKQWGERGGNQLLTYYGFDIFRFQKMNVQKWKDIPNRFQQGDICNVVGDETKFYVNGMYRPGDEIRGTNYFKADPGETRVQFSFSEWTTIKPTVKVRIREGWL